VFCVYTKIADHGGHPQWRHLVASSEANDLFHWVMRPVSYLRIRMVIKIASNSPEFVDYKDHCMVVIN
jgi:amino acid permease